MAQWKDFLRIDLQAIPIAESNGWLTKFSYNDKNYRRMTPQYVPHDSVSFEKLGTDGNISKVLWVVYLTKKRANHDYVIDKSWRCADLVGNKYCNHRNYETIELAMEKESETISI